MHIVIMGCGRVGSTLAHILEDRGNTVAVIDRDPEAFRRLRPAFKGDRVTGIGFDRDVLARAGIERADSFAAVSSGDNSNIIAARVARETFGVRQVAARIYDPRRAEVYERLGIPTVATVRWTADQMLRKLLPEGAEPLWRDATGKIVLSQVQRVTGMDRRAGQARRRRRQAPASPTSTGSARRCVPQPGTVLQEGDVVHVIAPENDLDRIEAAFATGPRGAVTDAGRHRRRRRGGQVHRPRAARERPRGAAHRPEAERDQGGQRAARRVAARRRLRDQLAGRGGARPVQRGRRRHRRRQGQPGGRRCSPRPSTACRGWSPGSTTRATNGCSTSRGASTWPCPRRGCCRPSSRRRSASATWSG